MDLFDVLCQCHNFFSAKGTFLSLHWHLEIGVPGALLLTEFNYEVTYEVTDVGAHFLTAIILNQIMYCVHFMMV